MSSRTDQHHKEDEATAYRLQVLGAREGALKGTLVAGSIVTLCHFRFPWMRRQTLAGKAFLTFWGAAFGMTSYADKYLIAWEREHRYVNEQWRTRARSELAAKGIVPNETSMREWKKKNDERVEELKAAREAVETSAAALPVAGEESK